VGCQKTMRDGEGGGGGGERDGGNSGGKGAAMLFCWDIKGGDKEKDRCLGERILSEQRAAGERNGLWIARKISAAQEGEKAPF